MKIKSLTALLLAVILLLCGCSETKEAEKEAPAATQTGIAIKSEHCTVTDAMLEYIFFFNFYNVYGNVTEYYNLDLNLTFTEQIYEEGVTWQEHLTEMAVENTKNDIFLAEEALAQGFEYPELEAEIDKNIESWKESAQGLQMTFEEYMVTYYGENATEQTLRNGLEIQLYATAYGNELKNRFKEDLTEEDYTEYYEENKKDIEIVDVLVYSIPINYNGIINTEKRDSLLACKTEEEFKAWIANDMTENNKVLDNPRTEEQLAEKIKENTQAVMSYYTEGGGFSEWAFAEEREIGDTHYTEQNTGMYDIYMLLKKPYAQEKYTNNICQILITDKYYATEEEAKTKADEILEELEANGGTREAFEELAEEYNEDTECFRENIASDFFPEDEMNNWANDEARKTGDTTIQKSSYGYHIIFYAGKGMQKWKAEAKESMVDKYIDEKLAQLSDTYSDTLEFNQASADNLPNMLSPNAATIIGGYNG